MTDSFNTKRSPLAVKTYFFSFLSYTLQLIFKHDMLNTIMFNSM